MSQAIKYESTSIDAVRTASEIVGLIVKYGGTRTTIEWDGGQPTGISFEIEDRTHRRTIPVRLEARTERVYQMLVKARPWTSRSRASRTDYEGKQREQATRIVWRHLKDLIEQQLLAVEIGQYYLAEVFLHGVVLDTGMTVGETMAQYAQVGSGSGAMRIGPGGAP